MQEAPPQRTVRDRGRNFPKQHTQRRILVVDDNVDAALTVAKLLRVWGHEVQAVGLYSQLNPIGNALLEYKPHIAFNLLEALLPSLVSRVAPAEGRGVAIGVYNTTQTIGVFIGGVIGGWVAEQYGTHAVFITCAVLSGLWLIVTLGMQPPSRHVNGLSSLTFSIASGVNLEGLSQALAAVRGVREAEVLARERIARLKVVPEQWDEGSVRKLLTGEG